MLTPRQLEIYDYLRHWVEEQGQAPTMAEICLHFGLKSTSTVHQALAILERRGFIRRIPNISRGIELIEQAESAADTRHEVPLLGVVAAGRPVEAILSHEEVCVPHDMKLSRQAFALRVRGDSMIEEQIRDGDLVIVEPRKTAENGQTVIALLDGSDTTVKKFFREENHIRLEPANPSHQTMVIGPPERLTIQGVVVGIIRRLS